ncbi:MAG: C39 family peptidase, partial [Chloroflexi bacterium]|nr:C39 family peptidase [Chloroflexota bacterium]
MYPRALLMGVALLIGCAAQSTAPAPIEPSSDPPASSRQAEAPLADDFSKAELRREPMNILVPGPSTLLGPMPHEYQRLNNCGPTSVAMVLGYFGQPTSQQDTAPYLKGGASDKNVSPREIAAYFRQRGFQARVRINGDLELLMTLLANGFPVIVQQWLERPDDALTGHYRIVLGFDRSKQVIIVNDAYLGPQVEI